jgi:hypothetical protein
VSLSPTLCWTLTLLSGRIGSIASLISNFDVLKSDFNKKTVQMDRFMMNYDMPSLLRRRVRRFHNYIYGDSKGTELDDVRFLAHADHTFSDQRLGQVLVDLPIALRKEILVYLFAVPIKTALGSHYARSLGTSFIHKLLMLVSLEKIPAKEFIMLKNQISTEIYFVVEGEVEILKVAEGLPVATFGPGNFFGERSILRKGRRKSNAYVRSK